MFPTMFEDLVILHPILVHPSFAIHFQNSQKSVGFIHMLDTLTESLLDHRRVTPNLKNEPHAAWEHSSENLNERRAAWGRLLSLYGPVGSPK